MPVYHKWQRIAELESAPEVLADGGLRTMLAVWQEQKGEIDTEALRIFNEKLRREWAVETGLIERIYTLDRGITETLIERGIDAAFIPHRDGRQLPEKTAAIIQDHKDVVDGLFDFVKGSRTISTSYIKELHAALVQNQDTATGVDQFGNKTEVSLIKGKYKTRPNNPTRDDGKGVHEYCPPEQTASEMDRLIEINESYAAKGIAPEVQAAWLHHRFTQIHPFQDGNGRVARCLATLIFIRAGGFPLTIRDIKDERAKYLDALEAADGGDLQALISVLAASQRREITRALNISREVMESTPAGADYQSRVENIIKAAAQKVAEREMQNNNRDNAQFIAGKMHEITAKMLQQTRQMLAQNITIFGEAKKQAEFLCSSSADGYYKNNVIYYDRHFESTDWLEHTPNFDTYHAWTWLCLHLSTHSEMLFSFHGIDKAYTGVLACSASFCAARKSLALTDEPFYINNQDTVADVEKRFRPWLGSAIERGLSYWHKSL